MVDHFIARKLAALLANGLAALGSSLAGILLCLILLFTEEATSHRHRNINAYEPAAPVKINAVCRLEILQVYAVHEGLLTDFSGHTPRTPLPAHGGAPRHEKTLHIHCCLIWLYVDRSLTGADPSKMGPKKKGLMGRNLLIVTIQGQAQFLQAQHWATQFAGENQRHPLGILLSLERYRPKPTHL